MKKIKAVFCDIDGTFFDYQNNRILESSVNAFKQLRKKGIKVVLCSGRSKELAQQLPVFELMEYDGYIGCSGAIVMNENFEIIASDTYTQKQMEEIFHIGKKHDLHVVSFGEFEFMTKPLDTLSSEFFNQYHLCIPEVREWNHEALSDICVLGDGKTLFPLFSHIEGLSYTSSTPYNFDFVKIGVNKANGIKKMMEYWGFCEHEYLAFGDAYNDIEMIKNANIGVAMGNAEEEVKKVADLVCGPCFEDSIADTLKKLQLI